MATFQQVTRPARDCQNALNNLAIPGELILSLFNILDMEMHQMQTYSFLVTVSNWWRIQVDSATTDSE